MNTVKENLCAYYNMEADLREQSEKQDWKLRIREEFCKLILSENKRSLLELGAGCGHDSQFFMSREITVTAVDMSSKMVAKCKEKSINAFEMDYYDLTAFNMKFDSVWAMNSLLHVPKSDLASVLRGIYSVLKPNGLFFMGVYGGIDSENEFINDRSEIPRFFSYYTEDRLRCVLKGIFQIQSFEQFDVGRDIDFQSIILRTNRGGGNYERNL